MNLDNWLINAKEKANVEFPRLTQYPKSESDAHICNFKIVYCDGDHDLERCNLCGREIRTTCSFDNDYS